MTKLPMSKYFLWASVLTTLELIIGLIILFWIWNDFSLTSRLLKHYFCHYTQLKSRFISPSLTHVLVFSNHSLMELLVKGSILVKVEGCGAVLFYCTGICPFNPVNWAPFEFCRPFWDDLELLHSALLAL